MDGVQNIAQCEINGTLRRIDFERMLSGPDHPRAKRRQRSDHRPDGVSDSLHANHLCSDQAVSICQPSAIPFAAKSSGESAPTCMATILAKIFGSEESARRALLRKRVLVPSAS